MSKYPHCFHKAPDPRCDGFIEPIPSYRSLYAWVGDEPGEFTESTKTQLVRKTAWVCCRCHRVGRKLRWWERFRPDQKCEVQPATRAVDRLLHEEGKTP